MDKKYITVSELTKYIAKKFKTDVNLKETYVKGEISNYKVYPSGHAYFVLKDKDSKISGVMFFSSRRHLKFTPKNGMKVLIKGKIEVYPKNGNYQLYALKITEEGIGDLHIAFEQLKIKLKNEGLFNQSHKKEIPKFPKRIGVVTAETGAAIKDIITTIKRRWPICKIILFPSLVQGAKASKEIVIQIKRAENYNLDILIVGRGGGSIEDLWTFNEEIVARAIYDCSIPTISAVGHEIDFTITDFTADLRAPTPTAAAELAVPKYNEIINRLHDYNRRANLSITQHLNNSQTKLNSIKNQPYLKNPNIIYEKEELYFDNLISRLNHESESIILKKQNILNQLINSLKYNKPENRVKSKEKEINELKLRLKHIGEKIITDKEKELEKYKNKNVMANPEIIMDTKEKEVLKFINKLDVLNPLLTLKRGYTLTKTKEGKIISSSKDVNKEDVLEIEFKDGTVNTKAI